MIFLKKCFVNTTAKIDLLPILPDIRYAIRDSGAKQGLVTVVTPDPHAGIAIGEPLPDFLEQLKAALELFPGEGIQTMTRRKDPVLIGPRIKAALLGRTITLPFADEKLILAPREEVMLVDFEPTPRRREFLIHVFGEKPEVPAPQAGPRRR